MAIEEASVTVEITIRVDAATGDAPKVVVIASARSRDAQGNHARGRDFDITEQISAARRAAMTTLIQDAEGIIRTAWNIPPAI